MDEAQPRARITRKRGQLCAIGAQQHGPQLDPCAGRKKVRQAGAEPVERAVLADDVVVERGIRRLEGNAPGDVAVERLAPAGNIAFEIGRASWRERVGKYV